MDWAKVERGRERLVLFPTRLDEAIGPRNQVRLFDEILSWIDWSAWEAESDLRRGQPPSFKCSAERHPLLTPGPDSIERFLPCQGLELGRSLTEPSTTRSRSPLPAVSAQKANGGKGESRTKPAPSKPNQQVVCLGSQNPEALLRRMRM